MRLNKTKCLLLALVWFLEACAPANWEALTIREVDLQWPPPPGPAKINYLGEIREFHQKGGGLTRLLLGGSEAGKIVKPVAIAVGKDGRMAIADAEKRGIHLYIPAEKKYRFIHKTNSEAMQSPVSVAFDGTLNLFVSDSALRKVLVYDSSGKLLRELAGTGPKPFGRPTGVSFQKRGGLLHIVDTGRHQIHTFDITDKYMYSIGGRGAGQNNLNFPTHIAPGPSGQLFVNDSMNFKIRAFDPLLRRFTGSFGRHGNGSGDFAMPKGIGVDRWGVVYVADCLFDAVQLFDQQGHLLLTLGSQGMGPGEFWMPTGIFIDGQDRLYVCDTYNHRIQIFQLLAFKHEKQNA